MNQTLFTLSILPGKTEQARAFLRALNGARREEFAACEKRLGVTKEVWAIQAEPQGDRYICYFTAADVGQVAAEFMASQEEFDVWFNAQLAETTGRDSDSPSAGSRSEILSDFQA